MTQRYLERKIRLCQKIEQSNLKDAVIVEHRSRKVFGYKDLPEGIIDAFEGDLGLADKEPIRCNVSTRSRLLEDFDPPSIPEKSISLPRNGKTTLMLSSMEPIPILNLG